MSTTTILHELERRLDRRLADGEITEATRNSYLNDASRVFEMLLRRIPAPVIEGYMEAEGYQGEYGTVIRLLSDMARPPGYRAFGE